MMPGRDSSGQRRRPLAGEGPASEPGATPPSGTGATDESDAAEVGAEASLETLMGEINRHLSDHHARTTEECQAVMGSVEASLEGLMDRHFSSGAEPARVSEMLLFHVMFAG